MILKVLQNHVQNLKFNKYLRKIKPDNLNIMACQLAFVLGWALIVTGIACVYFFRSYIIMEIAVLLGGLCILISIFGTC